MVCSGKQFFVLLELYVLNGKLKPKFFALITCKAFQPLLYPFALDFERPLRKVVACNIFDVRATFLMVLLTMSVLFSINPNPSIEHSGVISDQYFATKDSSKQ